MHRATLRLDVNKQVKLEVSFCPHKPVSVKAKMTLLVENNQFSSTIIQLTGETYQEIISLDNISRPSEELDQEDDESGKWKRRAQPCGWKRINVDILILGSLIVHMW